MFFWFLSRDSVLAFCFGGSWFCGLLRIIMPSVLDLIFLLGSVSVLSLAFPFFCVHPCSLDLLHFPPFLWASLGVIVIISTVAWYFTLFLLLHTTSLSSFLTLAVSQTSGSYLGIWHTRFGTCYSSHMVLPLLAHFCCSCSSHSVQGCSGWSLWKFSFLHRLGLISYLSRLWQIDI